MHDRSDYKHGWQIEQQWEKEHGIVNQTTNYFNIKKKRRHRDGEEEEEESDGNDDDPNKYVIKGVHSDEDDGLPFKCLICRESFINPVVTKCKHYFCEKCLIKQNKKSTRCFVCKTQTLGIFFVAKEIVQKIKDLNEELKDKEHENDD